MKLDLNITLDLNEDFYDFFSNKEYLKEAIAKILNDTLIERLKKEIDGLNITYGEFYEYLRTDGTVRDS